MSNYISSKNTCESKNHINSIWTDQIKIDPYPAWKGNAKTDVLIIGGGMAGILCAYFLKQAGVKYMLVEGNRILSGITKNTTAKITSQHGLIYNKLIKSVGYEKAKMYLDANELAVSKFKTLCKTISCDFEEKSAFVYSLTDRNAIEKEVNATKKIGMNAQFVDKIPLPFEIAGAIEFKNQAQFHPLKFMKELAKDLTIYENTFVKELSPHTAIIDGGKITAEKIIIATHFPFLNKHGSYFIKMYQHRSYAIALENMPSIHGMYLEETKDGMSFRNHQNMLIIGGGDHRTGKQGGNFKILREFSEKNYKDAKEVYAWATQDCMSLDGIPYIGNYSRSTEALYVATGFNKWGMTSSMVSAMLLTDMIIGKSNSFATVFSPSRSILKPQLLLNGCTAVAHLLTFTKKRCPHLGCALKWNPIEKTWDCPCHGSRFSSNGELIDNPATGNLKTEPRKQEG